LLVAASRSAYSFMALGSFRRVKGVKSGVKPIPHADGA